MYVSLIDSHIYHLSMHSSSPNDIFAIHVKGYSPSVTSALILAEQSPWDEFVNFQNSLRSKSSAENDYLMVQDKKLSSSVIEDHTDSIQVIKLLRVLPRQLKNVRTASSAIVYHLKPACKH
jgi:hypothetical protein